MASFNNRPHREFSPSREEKKTRHHYKGKLVNVDYGNNRCLFLESYENHTVGGQTAELLNVEESGTYRYHCALKG
jgi:hypothetical protein